MRSLIGSRVWEQGILGVSSLVLAREIGVDRFAVVSVLFVVNSFAVTVSDFGLGLAVLRMSPTEHIARVSMRRLRIINGAIVAVAIAIALGVGGSAAGVIGWSGALWAASAEAYVRKSAVIRVGRSRDAALAEILGTGVFGVFAGIAAAFPSSSLWLVGAGFTAKHLLEAGWVRHWREVFRADGLRGDLGLIWLAQVASFLAANVDYVTIGVLLTKPQFAVYVLAFRVANALPAQVANVTGRVSLVDFGAAADAAERQRAYDRYVPRLFVGGFVGAALTAMVAPLLPHLLGDQWHPIEWVVVVLALGVPWRMVLGVASAMVLGSRRTSTSVRWEATRAIAFAVIFAGAGLIGFGWVCGAVTVSIVVATLVYHLRASALIGVRPWRFLVPASVLTCVVAVAFSTGIGS